MNKNGYIFFNLMDILSELLIKDIPNFLKLTIGNLVDIRYVRIHGVKWDNWLFYGDKVNGFTLPNFVLYPERSGEVLDELRSYYNNVVPGTVVFICKHGYNERSMFLSLYTTCIC